VLCFPLEGVETGLRDVDGLANPGARVAGEVNLAGEAASTRREHSVKDTLRDHGKRGVGLADVGGGEAGDFTNASAGWAEGINMNQGTTDVDEEGVAWVPQVWGEVVLDGVGQWVEVVVTVWVGRVNDLGTLREDGLGQEEHHGEKGDGADHGSKL